MMTCESKCSFTFCTMHIIWCIIVLLGVSIPTLTCAEASSLDDFFKYEHLRRHEPEKATSLPSFLFPKNSEKFSPKTADNLEVQLTYPYNDTHVAVVNEYGVVRYDPIWRKLKPKSRSGYKPDKHFAVSSNFDSKFYPNSFLCKSEEDCLLYNEHMKCVLSPPTSKDGKGICLCEDGYYLHYEFTSIPPNNRFSEGGFEERFSDFPNNRFSEGDLVSFGFEEPAVEIREKTVPPIRSYPTLECWKRVVKVDDSCDESDQCLANDENTLCEDFLCRCRDGYYYSPKREICLRIKSLMQVCEEDLQCQTSEPRSYCRIGGNNVLGICSCTYHYVMEGSRCISAYPSVTGKTKASKSEEIYKVAMIAASCFLIGIIGIIMTYIIRRSFFRRRNSNGRFESGSEDVYSVENDTRFVGVDKPPSYLDVVREVEAQYGVPPPAYDDLPSTSSGISGNRMRQPRIHPPPQFTPSVPPSGFYLGASSSAVETQQNAQGSATTPTVPDLPLPSASPTQQPATLTVVVEEAELVRNERHQPGSAEISQESTPVAERKPLITNPSSTASANHRVEHNSHQNSQLPVPSTSTTHMQNSNDHEWGYRNAAFVNEE